MFVFKQTLGSNSGSTITQTAEAVLKVICFVIMSCRSPGFIIEAAFERPAYLCMHRQHTGRSQEHAASTAPFFTAAFGNEATGDAVAALNPVCNRGETTLSQALSVELISLSSEPDLLPIYDNAFLFSTCTFYPHCYITQYKFFLFIHNTSLVNDWKDPLA